MRGITAKIATLVKSTSDIEALEKQRDAMQNEAAAKEAEEKEIALLEDRLQTAGKKHEALISNAPPQIGILDLLLTHNADALAPKAAAAEPAIDESVRNFADALEALAVSGCEFDNLPDCPD